MCILGFLKFLKRDKKQDLGSLDLPPEPPSLEGFDDKLPDMPDFHEISAESKDFEFNFPENKDLDFGKDFEITPPKEQELPKFDRMESTVPAPVQLPEFLPVSRMPQSQAAEQESQPIQSIPEPDYDGHGKIFNHEGIDLVRPMIGKESYVRVEKFKMILGGINIVRDSLRKSDESFMKLENIKNTEDKSFDKVKSSLDDLQRKLIFIDKTLFKGE